jgi:hypothetical protein
VSLIRPMAVVAALVTSWKVGRISVFDIDRFAAGCRAALMEGGSDAIREVVRRAVSEPGDIIAALGEQTGAFAGILSVPPT